MRCTLSSKHGAQRNVFGSRCIPFAFQTFAFPVDRKDAISSSIILHDERVIAYELDVPDVIHFASP